MVVLEIYGTVKDFCNAVKNTRGMDWIGEWDIDELDPSDDFFDEAKPTSKLPGRLFLIMSSQQAIDQLIALHEKWKEVGSDAFIAGRKNWQHVFSQLKAVRRWGAQDRLHETGLLEAWLEDLPFAAGTIRFEAELVFRNDDIKRNKAFKKLSEAVEAEGGRCLAPAVHKEIEYHGAVIELPVAAVEGMLSALREGRLNDVVLFRTEEVLFFRPMSQSVSVSAAPNTTNTPIALESPLPSGPPLVAVLDGLPMSNHPVLQGRIIVHDPDGLEESYTAAGMVHGSGITSLVIHGDLSQPTESLSRPVHVRPILRLNVTNPDSLREEIPQEKLPADVTFSAIIEMIQSTEHADATAPQIRIVNLSVGDKARQYDGFMSPWARMIDWLSVKHRILFLISAGNHTQPVTLPISQRQYEELSPQNRQSAILKAVASDTRNRRLLAPAESLNGLTIGALHSDESGALPMGYRTDPYLAPLPAAYSAVGFGHRKAIKPELWVTGGKQFFATRSARTSGHTDLVGMDSAFAPGVLVAGPSANQGESSPMRYTRGTSGATAIASHYAGLICERLLSLRDEPNGEIIDDRFASLLTKALLVHGASWSESYDSLKASLKGDADEASFNRQVARFLGYGVPDYRRSLACTSSRATLLGRGSLGDGEAERFDVPLPPGLGGKVIKHRIITTLAWFSPIEAGNRNYRKACLWAEPPEGKLKLDRQDVNSVMCQKGTLQHDVYESKKAVPIIEGDVLSIRVNCCSDAGKLSEPVPYALAVTLEVVDAPDVLVYDEVRAALMARIAARSRV